MKIVFRFTNYQETNLTVRIAIVKAKPYLNQADWNHDVHRPINTTHWHVIKMDKFVIDTGDWTADGSGNAQPNASKMVTKTYYIPMNRWVYTNDGNPATAGTQWQTATSNLMRSLYIDTDDATSVDNQYLEIKCHVTQYLRFVDANQA